MMADKTDLSLSRRKNVHEREERNGHSEEVCDKSATERLLVLRLDDEGHSDFVEDPIPSCLQPNQNADLPELPELGVSSVKVPHPDNDPNTLVDLGMTFKTELVESIYQHSVVEVDDGSLAHRLNMRNGDIIHKINDFPLFDCEHGGVLDMFYNLDEEFDVTIRRQTEDNIDGGDSDDDQMMYVFTKFKLKMEITNNEVQIEVIAEFEEEYITKSDNEYPKLRCYYEGDCYIYTASSDSSLILSMTSSSSIAIIPAHINDDRGKWKIYRYSVVWPKKVEEKAKTDNVTYPSIAVVFYNMVHQQCLVVKKSALTVQRPLFNNLKKLKKIDSRIFFEKMMKGDDRIVFESAKYRGQYLAKSGKKLMLMKQDKNNPQLITKFSIHKIGNVLSVETNV